MRKKHEIFLVFLVKFEYNLKFRSKTGATSVFMRGCAVLSVWRNACHFTFQIVFF